MHKLQPITFILYMQDPRLRYCPRVDQHHAIFTPLPSMSQNNARKRYIKRLLSNPPVPPRQLARIRGGGSCSLSLSCFFLVCSLPSLHIQESCQPNRSAKYHWRGPGGGDTRVFYALVVGPLTTRPRDDEARGKVVHVRTVQTTTYFRGEFHVEGKRARQPLVLLALWSRDTFERSFKMPAHLSLESNQIKSHQLNSITIELLKTNPPPKNCLVLVVVYLYITLPSLLVPTQSIYQPMGFFVVKFPATAISGNAAKNILRATFAHPTTTPTSAAELDIIFHIRVLLSDPLENLLVRIPEPSAVGLQHTLKDVLKRFWVGFS